MVYPEAFNGMTPLHALSIACTENLPPSGLGNSLTVTNLPSSYTPRILLKLFQARYPSAYRATIPPVTMEGRKVMIFFNIFCHCIALHIFFDKIPLVFNLLTPTVRVPKIKIQEYS